MATYRICVSCREWYLKKYLPSGVCHECEGLNFHGDMVQESSTVEIYDKCIKCKICGTWLLHPGGHFKQHGLGGSELRQGERLLQYGLSKGVRIVPPTMLVRYSTNGKRRLDFIEQFAKPGITNESLEHRREMAPIPQSSKQMSAHRAMQTREAREKANAKIRRAWADPAVRARMIAARTLTHPRMRFWLIEFPTCHVCGNTYCRRKKSAAYKSHHRTVCSLSCAGKLSWSPTKTEKVGERRAALRGFCRQRARSKGRWKSRDEIR